MTFGDLSANTSRSTTGIATEHGVDSWYVGLVGAEPQQEGGTMRKIIVSLTAGLALAIGGAGLASAQTDPVVEVDQEEVAAGGDVTIGIEGAEPESEVEVEIVDATGSGTTDADGNGNVTVTMPDNVEPGAIDGIVTINGVEYPVSVVIAALQEEGGRVCSVVTPWH